MIQRYKIARAIFIALSFFVVSIHVSANQVSPQTFSQICAGNGEFFQDVRITSVMIMGAENNRTLYIAINNNNEWVARKDYQSNEPSDKFLISTIIKANILKSYVDLCITGKQKELYGINLK